MKKVNIPENAQITVTWNVLPYDYTDENEKALRTLISKKYNIPENRVEIVPKIKSVNGSEENNAEIKKELSDLCNTDNQLALFKKYLDVYDIKDYDWETIKSIDGDVNAVINYDKYDKYKKYKLKWIKWDNFLSYGEGNFFDFEKLNGMVLMNGIPANQTGKTTFAIDLIHFLLFGRCTPLKAKTNNDIFNHYSKTSQVKVEGCINIDGQDYVIRRTLSRPKNFTEKSKVTGSLEYFRVDGNNNYESLKEYDSTNADLTLNEDTVASTNKAIKDAIGREDDFDMIICATSQSLAELITSTGDTERGKLMTRWLGLDVIDDKSKLAKDVYSQQMGNALFKIKNKDVLAQENTASTNQIQSNNEALAIVEKTISSLNKTISDKEKECFDLTSTKTVINEELLRLDKVTIENSIQAIIDNGQIIASNIKSKENEANQKDIEIADKQNEIDAFGQVNIAPNALSEATRAFTDANSALNSLREQYTNIKQKKVDLLNGEFCPTCKQRLAGVNNTSLIASCDAELAILKQKGIDAKSVVDNAEKKLNDVNALINKSMQLQSLINAKQSLENQKNSILLAKSALETKRSDMIVKYKEQQQLLTDYNNNKDAIDKNTSIDRTILNLRNIIDGYRRNLTEQETSKINLERDNVDLTDSIRRNELDIKQIEKEEKLEKNWQIYLTMLGKNGVSKMEVRELTPIINIKLKELLSGVVDFGVEINVTDKNDVAFSIVTKDKENIIKANLATGSGFEKTISALALRFVLSSITSIPQPNFFVIDEILDGVASENYDKIKSLFDKIMMSKSGIDFILHCTHIDAVKDWHNSIITIIKKNHISTVSLSNMG